MRRRLEGGARGGDDCREGGRGKRVRAPEDAAAARGLRGPAMRVFRGAMWTVFGGGWVIEDCGLRGGADHVRECDGRRAEGAVWVSRRKARFWKRAGWRGVREVMDWGRVVVGVKITREIPRGVEASASSRVV